MSESGLEALPDVQELSKALPDVWEWSGGYPECTQVIRSPSQMSRSCQEALPDVREWSKGYLK